MSDRPNDFSDYRTAVKFHLSRLAFQGKHARRQPSVHEIAWARSQGMSPRKYAEWWQRKSHSV